MAAGRLSVPAGGVLAAEWRQLAPLVEPPAAGAVLAGLAAVGQVDGSVRVRRLRPAMLARYGVGQLLQELQDRHAGLTVLSGGHDIGGGITQYWLRLNPEARAVVEAAINALSAPTITDEASDCQTVDQRRGDALVQVCRRAHTLKTGHNHDPHNDTAAAADPAQDAGTDSDPGKGADAGGGLLGPETVRKLACDGNIIPVLLGARPAAPPRRCSPGIHLRPAPRAVASGSALHLPRLHRPRHLVRRPSQALGRRRRYRPG